MTDAQFQSYVATKSIWWKIDHRMLNSEEFITVLFFGLIVFSIVFFVAICIKEFGEK